MSLRRAAGAVGVSVDTADSYLEACEAAYLLFSVLYFALSERKRASRSRKYYPIDTGMRRLVVTRTGDDHGEALECATHLALCMRYREVFYWRGKGEVDFVVREGDRIGPHQVTSSSLEPRHHAALEEFHERFPQADEAVVVTAESFDELLGWPRHRCAPTRNGSGENRYLPRCEARSLAPASRTAAGAARVLRALHVAACRLRFPHTPPQPASRRSTRPLDDPSVYDRPVVEEPLDWEPP